VIFELLFQHPSFYTTIFLLLGWVARLASL